MPHWGGRGDAPPLPATSSTPAAPPHSPARPAARSHVCSHLQGRSPVGGLVVLGRMGQSGDTERRPDPARTGGGGRRRRRPRCLRTVAPPRPLEPRQTRPLPRRRHALQQPRIAVAPPCADGFTCAREQSSLHTRRVTKSQVLRPRRNTWQASWCVRLASLRWPALASRHGRSIDPPRTGRSALVNLAPRYSGPGGCVLSVGSAPSCIRARNRVQPGACSRGRTAAEKTSGAAKIGSPLGRRTYGTYP